LLTLGDDGGLREIKFALTFSFRNSCFSQAEEGCSGQVEIKAKTLSIRLPGILHKDYPVKSVVVQAVKIIQISLLSSAGGIPL
jgi:hypothetical protein